MTLVTLGELLDAGVHFGHQSSRWNPKMFPYIYTEQNGIHVIDLVQTARLLTHAYQYVQKAAKEGNGAAQLDGRMIDAASARMAENVVNINNQIKNK